MNQHEDVHTRHCYQGEYEDGCKYGDADCTVKIRLEMADKERLLTLSVNQTLFVREVERQGHEVYFNYSGRGMFGRTCPAVNVDTPHEIFISEIVTWDQMGLGFVVYARS